MTLANLKKHHARLKWLASGKFTERDFDYKIERSENEHGDSKHKGEGGWCTMGDFEGTKRKDLIQQDAQRHLKLFEKKYSAETFIPNPRDDKGKLILQVEKPKIEPKPKEKK